MAWPSLADVFSLRLTTWETYGLFFLLGSFAVATLSDLRRLSAQREFLEVWALFALAILGHGLWRLGGHPTALFALKWGLILALCLLSWRRVGVLFRLAPADVAACAAAASLLPAGFVLVYWALLKAAAWAEAPLLRRRGDAYPFLPVVTTATVLALALARYAPALLS